MEQLRKQLEQLRERLLNIKNSFLKPKIEIPSIHTKRGRLYRSAKNCLGQDVSLTEDELGCVESLREVAIRAGIFIRENKSTIGLLKELNNSNKFKRVDRPLIGDIILTPTKGKNIGHCGILGLNFKIFSNNSRNSLWDTYFNMLTWEIYYEQNKKLTTYYFRVLDSRVVGSAKLKNNNMNKQITKRLQSFVWRFGAYIVTVSLAWLANNIGLLELSPFMTTLIALGLGEITKLWSKFMDTKGKNFLGLKK